jgi:hypothetical protein
MPYSHGTRKKVNYAFELDLVRQHLAQVSVEPVRAATHKGRRKEPVSCSPGTIIRCVGAQHAAPLFVFRRSVQSARRFLLARIRRRGAELQEIDQHLFAILEAGRFQERLLFSGMKGQRDTEKIY